VIGLRYNQAGKKGRFSTAGKRKRTMFLKSTPSEGAKLKGRERAATGRFRRPEGVTRIRRKAAMRTN